MKIISRIVFVSLVAGPFLLRATSVSAEPQPEMHPANVKVTPQLDDSRAEEWRKRRSQKRQQSTPEKSSGFEKILLYAEGGGFEELLSIRFKDFYPKFGQISTGSGSGPGLRFFKSDIGGSFLSVETSGAISFAGYKMADFHFGHFNKMAPNFFLGPAILGAPFEFGEEQPEQARSFLYAELRYRYFPREDFYGLGPDSKLEDRTDFLLEDGVYNVVAGHQFTSWLGAGVRAGYLRVNTGTGTDDRFANLGDVFGDASAPGLERQPDFLRLDAAIYLDYRDTPGNPHQGGAVGISFSRFDDRGGDEFEFNAYSLDVRHYLPLGSRQRILALRLFGSWEDTSGGSRAPFYLQRTLGGKETLRGFRQFRFRDSNLLYFSAEYRWEAAPAVEFVLFYDAGKVFPDSQDFGFKHMEKSIGAGVRFKTAKRLVMRLDVGRSKEGTRVLFQFGPSF